MTDHQVNTDKTTASLDPTSYEFAKRRLVDISNLPNGWRFGEGVAIDRMSIEFTGRLLDILNQAGVKEMEVFPDAKGFVRVSIYQGDECIELGCGCF